MRLFSVAHALFTRYCRKGDLARPIGAGFFVVGDWIPKHSIAKRSHAEMCYGCPVFGVGRALITLETELWRTANREIAFPGITPGRCFRSAKLPANLFS